MPDEGVDKVGDVSESEKETGEVGETSLDEVLEMDGDGMRVGAGAADFIMGDVSLYIMKRKKNTKRKAFNVVCVSGREKKPIAKGPR
jgi:hypothetical protein